MFRVIEVHETRTRNDIQCEGCSIHTFFHVRFVYKEGRDRYFWETPLVLEFPLEFIVFVSKVMGNHYNTNRFFEKTCVSLCDPCGDRLRKAMVEEKEKEGILFSAWSYSVGNNRTEYYELCPPINVKSARNVAKK